MKASLASGCSLPAAIVSRQLSIIAHTIIKLIIL
jgi:hypothetical protein